MALQSIEEELRGLSQLNKDLVDHIYNRVVRTGAKIGNCILVMQKSGIPEEACNVFRVTQYEDRMLPMFKRICYTISEEHIPAIRGWMEDLVNQYCYATGAAIDIGWYLMYPDPSQSANVSTPLIERNSNVNDYALQCVAICDLADFLVAETENLDDMLKDYKNWRYRMLMDGVPDQIYDHYENNYAKPLEGYINYSLREALTDAYRYLVEMYDQIVASMNRIGLSVDRVPRALAAAGYGGGGASSSATTSNNVVQSPAKNDKEDKVAQAREQNLKEMEKYFGKPNPEIKHNIAKADKQNANPNYQEGDGYAINCATCALAYVLRYCFGFDVTAKENTKGRDNLNYWLSHGNSFKLWKNADGTPAQPSYMVDWMKQNHKKEMISQDYKRYFDEVCKDKGVYILTLNWKRGYGHATILQRDEQGKLYHIEPQVYDTDLSDQYGRRNIDDLVDELAFVPNDNKGILRVDDKIFDVGEQSFYINEGTCFDPVSGIEYPNSMTRVMDDGNHGIGEREVVKMSYSDLVDKML